MIESILQNNQIQHKGLIIEPLELTGSEQMLIDLMLLDKSIKDQSISMIIRFYTWKGDWLSIGKNQKNIPQTWQKIADTKRMGIVRRPSGGNAVLHSGGLTYCLIWDSPPKNKKESYRITSRWLTNGFAELGIKLQAGSQTTYNQLHNCFAVSTAADLINEYGNKQIGSAQYWKEGNLLQHGEIIIEPNQSLWVDLFNSPPPKRKPAFPKKKQLEESLQQSLIKTRPDLNWYRYRIKKTELNQIKIEAEKSHLGLKLF